MHRQTIQIYLQSPWVIRNGKAIAPVTIMTEGVHNGSHGSIYWAAHILRNNAHKWEGVPIAFNHPSINGKNVSIKETPNQIIGHVRRPYFCENKKAIKAEIEIQSNHPQLSMIQSTKEVSAGVFSDEQYQSGIWNNEQYSACSIAMEPDHLALLPGGRGACSWEDGCGIRTNSNEIFTNAFINCINYIKGNYNMNTDEKLLPTGLNVNDGNKRLRQIQKEADWKEILLPTCMNFNQHDQDMNITNDNSESLLPTGLN